MEPGYAISLANHPGHIALTNDIDQASLSDNMNEDDLAFRTGSYTGFDLDNSQGSSPRSPSPTTIGAFQRPLLHLEISSVNFFRVSRRQLRTRLVRIMSIIPCFANGY